MENRKTVPSKANEYRKKDLAAAKKIAKRM